MSVQRFLARGPLPRNQRYRCERHDCRRGGKIEDAQRTENRQGRGRGHRYCLQWTAHQWLFARAEKSSRAIEAQGPGAACRNWKNTIGARIAESPRQLRTAGAGTAEEIQHRTSNIEHRTSNLKPLRTSRAAGLWTTFRALLPKNLDVVIRKGSWDMLPIFRMIESQKRRAGCGALPGLQHGHRHGEHRRGGQGGRGFEIHPRAKATSAWLIGES